jgi:prolyl-tRNA editing enzyme YbaK/EbsC (Cys-tRNA(Pro) deacylase)
LGLNVEVVEFGESTRSAKDAAAAIGCELGQIVKSLVFKTRKTERPVLILASGVNRVSEALIRDSLGEKLGKADAEFVRQSTGFAIGGVPPFGLANKLPIFIDEDLLKYSTLWAAAGTPNAVFELTPHELLEASEGIVRKVSEGDA